MNTHESASTAGRSTGFSAVIPFSLSGCQNDKLKLAITTTAKGLAGIDYVHDLPLLPATDKFTEQVVNQLERYYVDPQWRFDLPIDFSGTEFQQRLWWSLCEVPVGYTHTYGQLARFLKSGAQAVGQACRRNPVPVVVPCHRIVSRQGLGGYAGEVDGEKLRIKTALLTHEGCRLV